MFSKLDDQRLLTLERFYSTNEIFSETTHLFVLIVSQIIFKMRQNKLKTRIAVVQLRPNPLHIRFIDLGNALWISIIPEFLQTFNRNIFLKLIRSFALSRVPAIYSFHPTVIPYLRYASRKDSGNL